MFRRLLATIFLLVSAGAGAAETRECLFTLGGTVLIDGPCRYESVIGDGSFRITRLDGAHSAQVEIMYGNSAEGWFNNLAHSLDLIDPLGFLQRHDACWQNDRAKVCAW